MTVKTFIMLQKFIFQINAVLLNFVKKNCIMVSTKTWSSTLLSTLMIEMFLNQHIRMISEGSCDTEDWSNDAENTALHHKNKLHLKIYSNRNCNFKCLLYFWSHKCSLGEHKIILPKTLKKSYRPQTIWTVIYLKLVYIWNIWIRSVQFTDYNPKEEAFSLSTRVVLW